MMGGWDFRFGAAMPFDGGSYGEGSHDARAGREEGGGGAASRPAGPSRACWSSWSLPDYVIATTHLDHVSPEAQLEQVRTINREMMRRYGDSPKPVFLGGDLNAEPGSETLRLLERTWRVLTPTDLGTLPSTSRNSASTTSCSCATGCAAK